MASTYTRKEILRIVITAAKDYDEKLKGNNYIFIYLDKYTKEICFFETLFLARHFQHLTGLDYIDSKGNIRRNSVDFYNKCISNQIAEKEICLRKDGTTKLKMEALPRLVNFLYLSKITVTYNGIRPKLTVDRLVGNVNYCLGFTKEKRYFMPSSCLLEDIRNLGNDSSQILVIMSKKADGSEKVYKDIRYAAKGVELNKLAFSDDLKKLIFFNQNKG